MIFIWMRTVYEKYNQAPNYGLLEPAEVVDGELPTAIATFHFLEVVAALEFLRNERLPWNAGS